ncbi:MAG: hypothetical protein IKN54_02655 [Lachnospiraceae bacterium]|nr:hypothetical protein [Lachnospiraceae bacterium]
MHSVKRTGAVGAKVVTDQMDGGQELQSLRESVQCLKLRLRHSGSYYDCSSLAYYAWLDAEVDISYGGATTASWEAKGLADSNETLTCD